MPLPPLPRPPRRADPRAPRRQRARWARRAAAAALLAGAAALLGTGCSSTPALAPSATQARAQASQALAARAWQRGDLAQAQHHYQAMLDAATALQDPALAGSALLNLALVHARHGQADAAQAQVDRILQAPQFFGPALQAQAAARKALLLLDGPAPAQAGPWIHRASAGCTDGCTLAPLLANLRAQLALQQGDTAGAWRLADTAAALASAQGQPAEQASALRLQARAGAGLGQTGPALQALAQALAIDRRLGQPDQVALTLVLTGDLFAQQGDAAQARDAYQRALDVYTASGQPRLAEQARLRLATVAGPVAGPGQR